MTREISPTAEDGAHPRRALTSTVQIALAAAIGGYFLALVGVAVLNDIFGTLRTARQGLTGRIPPTVSASWGQLVSVTLAAASALSSAKAAARKSRR